MELVQFAFIFSLLNKGKPMIDYEDFKPLKFSIYSKKNIELMRLTKKWQNPQTMKWKKALKLLSKMPSL